MGSPYTPLNTGGANKNPLPSYNDLGKDCRDLFGKFYNLGQFNVNVKNRTCHGVEITTSGSHNAEDKSAKGEVNVKAIYPFLPAGVSTTHKWNTDNIFLNELILQDTLFPGLKVATEFRLNGDTSGLGGKLTLQQKLPCLTVDAFLDGSSDSNLILNGSLVTGYKNIMAACKFDFDANATELKGNCLGFAYNKDDYSFFVTRDNNKSIYEGFFNHKINREVQIAVTGKVGDEGGTQFGIAGRYMFHGYGHALRARVNNQSMLGLGLELKIVPGWQAFAATEVDLKKLSEGNHKIGFGMDFGYD